MLYIIRIKAQENSQALWDDVLANAGRLQEALNDWGRMLYLSKRRNHDEVSLFLHMSDSRQLGDFMARYLAKLKGVTDLWLIHMLKPRFLPLAEDAGQTKRYAITLRVFPAQLSEVYEKIARLALPEGIRLGYVAYTMHLFGDSLQFSLLGRDAEKLASYLKSQVESIPGVLHMTVCEIERTHSFLSRPEWDRYVARLGTEVSWDAESMAEQFRN